jgi:hypothetical protein
MEAYMFGLELLEIAIGLVFIYLLLSLICTSLREMIESYLKQRASDLERGIREMLTVPGQSGGAVDYVSKLYKHPLVRSLYQGDYDPAKKGNLPSYIPARTFALALMDVVMPTTDEHRSGAAGSTYPVNKEPLPLHPLWVEVNKIPNQQVKEALIPLLEAGGDDMRKVRENIEEWYNSSMDRVSGWYKRRSQVIVLVLGIIIAVIVNADTIILVRSLANDAAVRNALVTLSQEYVNSNAQSATPKPNADSQYESCKEDENSSACKIEKNLSEVRRLGLPLGWDFTDTRSAPPFSLEDPTPWLSKICGWLITAFAISLGAPFWFDVLNKFIVIRSTVKPKEKSIEEEPK